MGSEIGDSGDEPSELGSGQPAPSTSEAPALPVGAAPPVESTDPDPSQPLTLLSNATAAQSPRGKRTPQPDPPHLIGERPDADRLARAVARMKIANQLFSHNEHVKLGRYHLLESIGSGGMGVVWGAFDPELDRSVAIKLVKAEVPSARERIVAEGQSLAKLAHPNVVTVFDVGQVGDEVYIVMEWVRGKNLRTHCKSARTVREILEIYRAAGEGLAAAHGAGLIHRDFKPDNAILGDDGRVRVLDFGLARSEVTAENVSRETPDSPPSNLTYGAGTPRYMPSEQAEGLEITPAVDQYAFCVSLREALVGRDGFETKPAEIPSWIEAILTKGSARERIHRFPSMQALLRALARDPALIWRRRLLAGAAVAATGGAFAIGIFGFGDDHVDRCVGGRDEIGAIWNPQVQAKLTSHLDGLGGFAKRDAARITGELQSYADTWASSHGAACQVQDRGELTAQMYERTLMCMARAKVAFATAVEVLSTATATDISDAVTGTGSLPDVTRCITDGTLSSVALPAAGIADRAKQVAAEVERVRALALASRPSAVAAAATALDDARALSYPPLVARAELARAMALLTLHPEAAFAPLATARTIALDAHDDALAVEAYARQLFAISKVEGTQLPARAAEDTFSLAAVIEPIARRVQPTGGFERCLLYMNLGSARLLAEDLVGARAWLERARDLVRASKLENLELEHASALLAELVDDRGEKEAMLEASSQRFENMLGPNHPTVLEAKLRLAVFTRRPDRAAALTRAACATYRELHPHLDQDLSECLYELGWLAHERGDLAEARAALSNVPELGMAHRAVAVRGLLASLDHPDEQIASELETRGAVSTVFWERGWVSDTNLACGLVWKSLGRNAAAIRCFSVGVALLEQGKTPFARRLARLRAELARVLVASDRERARVLARDAMAYYAGVPGYEPVGIELAGIAAR